MSQQAASYTIYIVLCPFREVVPELQILLEPLGGAERYLPGVEGYYDAATDTALLGLPFARKVIERAGSETVLQLVSRCHLPIVAPEELAQEQRQEFFEKHLANYTTYLQQYRGRPGEESAIQRVVDALRDHVAGLPEPADDPYESLEISSERGGRASSQWEIDVEPQRRKRASSEWETLIQ